MRGLVGLISLAAVSLLLVGSVSGCSSETEGDDEDGSDDAEVRSCSIPKYERKVDFLVRRPILTMIQQVAKEEQMPNAALLVAGLGAHETGLIQCWKDARNYCQGPYSSTCGGPVLAGGNDGPCSSRQGGLGMFQFDNGTYDQTIQTYGKDLLTETGNVRAAVKLIVTKLRVCPVGPKPATDEEARAWLDTVRVGAPAYGQYLDAMARCYNGAATNTCRFKLVRAAYDAATRYLLEDGGEAYWYGPTRVASAAPTDETPL
jgi:hypothetical protein